MYHLYYGNQNSLIQFTVRPAPDIDVPATYTLRTYSNCYQVLKARTINTDTREVTENTWGPEAVSLDAALLDLGQNRNFEAGRMRRTNFVQECIDLFGLGVAVYVDRGDDGNEAPHPDSPFGRAIRSRLNGDAERAARYRPSLTATPFDDNEGFLRIGGRAEGTSTMQRNWENAWRRAYNTPPAGFLQNIEPNPADNAFREAQEEWDNYRLTAGANYSPAPLMQEALRSIPRSTLTADETLSEMATVMDRHCAEAARQTLGAGDPPDENDAVIAQEGPTIGNHVGETVDYSNSFRRNPDGTVQLIHRAFGINPPATLGNPFPITVTPVNITNYPPTRPLEEMLDCEEECG